VAVEVATRQATVSGHALMFSNKMAAMAKV
jgi:hypothetical protein